MTDLNMIAQNYIAAWNETDADRRAGPARGGFHGRVSATAIRSCRATDVTASRQLIDGVQHRFAGFRFTLKGQAGRLRRPHPLLLGIWDRKARRPSSKAPTSASSRMAG